MENYAEGRALAEPSQLSKSTLTNRLSRQRSELEDQLEVVKKTQALLEGYSPQETHSFPFPKVNVCPWFLVTFCLGLLPG